jgi:PAS domain S-box-containing protein
MSAARGVGIGATVRRMRVPLHWVGVTAALVVLVTAASVGSRLIAAAGRAPGAVEAALQAGNHTATALAIVANMEADRRALQLTGMREHLAALQQDHDHIHEVLGGLRDAVAGSPELAGHVDSAEQAIGSWRDDVATGGARSARGGVERDRALLGSARDHLDRISSATESRLRAARQRVADARTRARQLWLATTGATLIVIVALAQLAHARQGRVRRSAREMELLLDALPFALVSLDRNGTIRHATGQARALFGVSAGTLAGCRLVDCVAALDRQGVEWGVARAGDGASVVCEAQVHTEFDAARVLSLTLAPIVERGRLVGVSAVVRDATPERALKTQARETERLARVGTIAAGVAHELNGALASIIGATSLVDGAPLQPNDRAALVMVQAEARRAARTVQMILDFSRRDAHRHEPQRIADVLERAVTLRRFDPRSHDVEFRLDVPPDVPMVMGDAQELLQVFLNLLVNAEHAVRNAERRCVTIDVCVERHRVLVRVTDTGPGIPDDQLEAVFQPFYTTKPRGDGTGLGLTLARGVVVEHQGSIWAERAPEGGARFVVALPAISAPSPDSVTTDLRVGPPVAANDATEPTTAQA